MTATNTKTIGFKAMDMTMKCNGFQFEVGCTYHVGNDKPLEVCTDSGFHFCQRFEDVFHFYDWFNCRVFLVETNSDVVTNGNKSITKEITILSEITKDDINYKELKTYESKNYYNLMLNEDIDFIFNKYKSSRNHKYRAAVANRMTDEQLMFETFKDDKNDIVRAIVVFNLSDEELIYQTFAKDKYWGVRFAVVKSLSDEPLIYKTFANDNYWYIRSTVIERLNDELLLFDTFRNDSNYLVRKALVNKLNDVVLLSYFANDVDDDVRKAAMDKIYFLSKPALMEKLESLKTG